MKIQYQNKEAIDLQPEVPAKNKVTDLDMNEIKAVVNTNADTLDTLAGTTENFVTETDNRLQIVERTTTEVKTDVETLEENTYTKTEVDNLINGVSEDIPTKTSDLTNDSSFVNETQLNNAINNEKTLRENADNSLQSQIDGIVASSDVVDIVGSYQELQNYDTTHLGDNDIIKVLDDNTHNNATSYYRWKKSTSAWQYIGSEGPYYTKAETDSLLNGKVNVVTGKGLSTNDFTTALLNKLNGIETGAQVNKIESIKVNNATQTITNKSVNISVPTKTSDISNDSGFITKSVNNLDNYYAKTQVDTTFTNYYNKTQIDSIIGDIDTALDTINRGGG